MLKINSQKLGFPLFIYNDGVPILLPTFFSCCLSKKSVIYVQENWKGKDGFGSTKLLEKSISENTAIFIPNRLASFLEWVEEYARDKTEISLEHHSNLPDEIINYYLNEVLIGEKGVGEIAIQQHLSALNAYYNYLAQCDLARIKRLFIKPKFKETARKNNKKRTAVKYLTPELRSILYQNTHSIRDELLLRTGGELGLRSKENQGFLVEDFKVGTKTHPGMKTLFALLDTYPEQMEFEYYLQGIFTKAKRYSGGVSRVIYFNRSLLERFREYYDKERPLVSENTFFLNNSPAEHGTPISKSRASDTFRDVKLIVLEKQAKGLLDPDGQQLEEGHTHHTLRHSFGTDKFYDFAEEKGIAIDDVTTTSSVYLVVAALMGHTTSDGSAPQTTKKYIRSCHIKKQFEVF